ncbi:hypothetical protein [Vibrio breoganii]|uniref:hypothetical protein n=1 Tax=Vibrio breoganii TaxID=553239 RepID=UPI000C815F48|nr:hypothetical protein [Vibrio breoganii]PMO34296.1 hypothetical protein BCT12_14465 [Vibrio breoganii]
MFKQTLNAIKAFLYDKPANPFVKALLGSWAVWNIKVVMLFFSSLSYSEKIEGIDSFYSQTFFLLEKFEAYGILTSNYFLCIYVMPLFTAGCYLYPVSWISGVVSRHTFKRQVKLNNKKKELQKIELISTKEKAELLDLVEVLKTENRSIRVTQREELEELQSLYEKAVKERDDAKNDVLGMYSFALKGSDYENNEDFKVLLERIKVDYSSHFFKQSSGTEHESEALKKSEKFMKSLEADESRALIAEGIVLGLGLDSELSLDRLSTRVRARTEHRLDSNEVHSSRVRIGAADLEMAGFVESKGKDLDKVYSLTHQGQYLYNYFRLNHRA